MAYITPTQRSALLARRATYQAELDLAHEAYAAALTPNESYEFDDGATGRQKAKRHKPSVISQEIERLEAAIDKIDRKLAGGGLVSIQVRRR